MNRRLPEATALRDFFQEQWDHLQQLIKEQREERQRQQMEREELSNAVEIIVDATDARLRAIGSYKNDLRDSARSLLDHIDNIVAAMPAAVRLSQNDYLHNPLVNMLFKSPAQIHDLFSHSQSIQDFSDNIYQCHTQEVFALLFLKRREKNILGAELQGEIIQKEVKQTSVVFYGHRLVAPGATEQEVRTSLKNILLESAVKYIDREISKKRNAQSEKDLLDSLKNPQLNLNNPEYYLRMLVKQMELPHRLIGLQGMQLRVSKMGIKLPLNSNMSGNDAKLYELEVGQDHSRILSLVKYTSDEQQSLSAVQNIY